MKARPGPLHAAVHLGGLQRHADARYPTGSVSVCRILDMTVINIFKWLYENKFIAVAPGWAALVLVGAVELFQIKPLHAELVDVKDAVKSLQVSQLEERLDSTYAALCQNPGDQAILQRIRELQQRYLSIEKSRYSSPGCSLLLKIK